jgi:hypothetical protein
MFLFILMLFMHFFGNVLVDRIRNFLKITEFEGF